MGEHLSVAGPDPVDGFVDVAAELVGPVVVDRPMYQAPGVLPARGEGGVPRGWLVRWALDYRATLVLRVDERGKLILSFAVSGGDGRAAQLRWEVDAAAVGTFGQRLVGLAELASAMPRDGLYYACPAHGDPVCGVCAQTAPGGLDECGSCTECEFYELSGMHWDTCANRVRAVATG